MREIDEDYIAALQEKVQSVLGYPMETSEACELILRTSEMITNICKAATSWTNWMSIMHSLAKKYDIPTTTTHKTEHE